MQTITQTPEEKPVLNFTGTVAQIIADDIDEQDIEKIVMDLGSEWPRIVALASQLRVEYEECLDFEVSNYESTGIEACGETWEVYDGEEMETAWDESLQNYVDDVILPEIPEHYHDFFNKEGWKDHAKSDGVGHCLNFYDGHHHEIEVYNTTYHLFRQN